MIFVVRIAYFRESELAQLEHHGIDLVNAMVQRIRASGLLVPRTSWVPEGPHFVYNPSADLFFGRRGSGPLVVVWDTNLAIDYFEHGSALWFGKVMGDVLPPERGDQMESLQLIMALWVLRDIRFRLLPEFMSDSRRGLPAERVAQRSKAWGQFCSALALVAAKEDRLGEPLILPQAHLETALKRVPAGHDRGLVARAVRERAHVFLTCDKGILGAAPALRPHGLRIVDPVQLLEDLVAQGAFHCLVEPRYLYWSLPDQQRVAHLVLACVNAAPE